MVELTDLKRQIESGANPDLYRGIRSLDPRFPVSPEISDAFMQTAAAIKRLFPDRVSAPVNNAYDARVAVIDFCEHPETTRKDILCVLEDSISWLSSEGVAT